jgi:DNA-binding cell septation regulator SpoVG
MTSEKLMTVLKYRPQPQGATLQGFANVQLPSGMIVNDIAVHVRDNGARWVAMPSRSYEINGERKYQSLVDFSDSRTRSNFQRQALAAIDQYINHNDSDNKNADTSFDTSAMTDEQAEASKQRCAQAAAGVRENARRFERARPGEARTEKRP